eukprot:1143694-Pelagomonas_calceolata.AAC.7
MADLLYNLSSTMHPAGEMTCFLAAAAASAPAASVLTLSRSWQRSFTRKKNPKKHFKGAATGCTAAQRSCTKQRERGMAVAKEAL